ncbi:Sas10/Utp3/C1D family domain containing protein [Elaphomyces granulatus]
MEAGDLIPLFEQLEDNVDDLEEVLLPLLQGSLSISDMSKKLPLLDRAKLHVLITYTLESLIFSYLRLRGVDSREHPVYRELTRVKQYFEKVKVLETGPEKRTMTLDKQAADRFIKHGLSGNDRLDLERAEKEAKEKALAQLRATILAKKNAVSQQASTKERSSHTPDSGSRSASESDSHSNRSESAEGGVPVVERGVPVVERCVPVVEGGVPVAQGGVGVPVAQGGVPVAQGGVPVAGGGVPVVEGGMPVVEEGVFMTEAPTAPAQQPFFGKTGKEKQKEKAKERREKFKAAKAVKKQQQRLKREGEDAEFRKAKNLEKKRRRAAKVAARRAEGFPMGMQRPSSFS